MCNFIACKTAKIKICSSKLTFQLSSLGVHKVSMVSPTLFIRSPRKCSDIRSATQPLSHSAHSIWMQMHGAQCTARLVAQHTHTHTFTYTHTAAVVVALVFRCRRCICMQHFFGGGLKGKGVCQPSWLFSCGCLKLQNCEHWPGTKIENAFLAVLRMDSAAGGRARVEP